MPSRSVSVPLGRRRYDLILLCCVVIIWGSSWPVMKDSVATVSPIWFTLLRYLIGALVLGGILVIKGRLRLPPRHDMPIVLSVGLLQMLVFTLLATTALQILPAGRAVILAYTMPLWVLAGTATIFGAQVGVRQILASAIGAGGIFILLDFGGLPNRGFENLLPCALLLVAAMAWALSMLHVQHHRWRRSALELAPWQMLLATSCLLPFALVAEGMPAMSWLVETWDSLFYVGIFATAFCSWAIVDLGTRIGAGILSTAMVGVPAVGLATSFAVGQDVPSLVVLAGSAAVLFAIGFIAADELRAKAAR